jgi:GNAT superfamily N-acetyltransferase
MADDAASRAPRPAAGRDGARSNIRRITAADIPVLFEIRPRTRENALTLDELRAMGITPDSVASWLTSSTQGWLCETPAGQAVGFCMADSRSGELLVIALLPEAEGRGIGGRLMGCAESWLAQSGCARAWLTTDLDPSLRAYGFYRHRGWTDWKLEHGLRWMQLSLPPGGAAPH